MQPVSAAGPFVVASNDTLGTDTTVVCDALLLVAGCELVVVLDGGVLDGGGLDGGGLDVPENGVTSVVTGPQTVELAQSIRQVTVGLVHTTPDAEDTSKLPSGVVAFALPALKYCSPQPRIVGNRTPTTCTSRIW